MLASVIELEMLNHHSDRRGASAVKSPRKEEPEMAKSEEGEYGEIGFTNADRKTLIEVATLVGLQGKTLDRYEARFDRVERERISKEDHAAAILAVQKQIADMSAALQSQINAQALAQAHTDTRLATLDTRVWKYIAATGGAFTAVVYVLKIFKVL